MKQKDVAQNEKKKCTELNCTDETYAMATFDMQGILQLPANDLAQFITNTSSYCTILLSVRGKPNRGFCCLWPATTGQRGANEISTCVLRYLKSLDKKLKKGYLFLNSCRGPNRSTSYTVSQKSVPTYCDDNFVKSYPIFNILSLQESLKYTALHYILTKNFCNRRDIRRQS